MSHPQVPPRSFLPFGNPFHMILPRGSSLSPKMLDLLNTFEKNLAGRLKKLKPAGGEDVLSLSWMSHAMESLCEIHADIKLLIAAVELPLCHWYNKWIDVYLKNSMKLLDIGHAFNSEISRLRQGHFLLLCALHDSDTASLNSYLDEWRLHIGSKNSNLDKIFCVMDTLAQAIDLPKVKNSSKDKVLMQAMYGVKVVTLFICSIFAAAFSGSAEKLVDIQVAETCLWADAFADLQTFVNTEIRNMHSNGFVTFLKELGAVETDVEKLHRIVEDGVENPVADEVLQNFRSDLEKSAEKLSEGLDLLAKNVHSFNRGVLNGRAAFLSNLRLVGNVPVQVQTDFEVEVQAVW